MRMKKLKLKRKRISYYDKKSLSSFDKDLEYVMKKIIQTL